MSSFSPEAAPIRVLFIEPDVEVQKYIHYLASELKETPLDLVAVKDLREARDFLLTDDFAVILLGVNLGDSQGIEDLLKIQTQIPHLPIICISQRDNGQLARNVIRHGAQDFLVKSKLDPESLLRSMQMAFERQAIIEILKKKNESWENIDWMKSSFISKISHEFRTPMTIMISSLENLRSGTLGPLSEKQTKWVDKIKNNSNRLEHMLTDLLDLSKLKSRRDIMHREPTDIGYVIKCAVISLKQFAQKKRINLYYRIDNLLIQFWADPRRIEQVLIHLISNAIKFTPEGGSIEISASQSEDRQIKVTVSDTGSGVPADQLKSIFNQFEQIRSEGKAESSLKGIGLGLPICQEIIRQHHGDIWAECNKKKGIQFSFRIPIDIRNPRQKPLNILVVDDDEDICDMLKVSLQSAGYKVKVCRDGASAIKVLSENENVYDMVFLDLMLPGKNGVDVIKFVRDLKIGIEIVVITAYPKSDLLLEGMETGPLTIIPKPFKPETVLELAAKIYPNESNSPPSFRKRAA